MTDAVTNKTGTHMVEPQRRSWGQTHGGTLRLGLLMAGRTTHNVETLQAEGTRGRGRGDALLEQQKLRIPVKDVGACSRQPPSALLLMTETFAPGRSLLSLLSVPAT